MRERKTGKFLYLSCWVVGEKRVAQNKLSPSETEHGGGGQEGEIVVTEKDVVSGGHDQRPVRDVHSVVWARFRQVGEAGIYHPDLTMCSFR